MDPGRGRRADPEARLTDGEPSCDRPAAGRRRYQFGVWVWFPVALLASVVLGAVSGMLHADSLGGPLSRGSYVLLIAAIPIGMVVLAGLMGLVLRGRSGRGPRRRR